MTSKDSFMPKLCKKKKSGLKRWPPCKWEGVTTTKGQWFNSLSKLVLEKSMNRTVKKER
jgi:hypothetical protein